MLLGESVLRITTLPEVGFVGTSLRNRSVYQLHSLAHIRKHYITLERMRENGSLSLASHAAVDAATLSEADEEAAFMEEGFTRAASERGELMGYPLVTRVCEID